MSSPKAKIYGEGEAIFIEGNLIVEYNTIRTHARRVKLNTKSQEVEILDISASPSKKGGSL